MPRGIRAEAVRTPWVAGETPAQMGAVRKARTTEQSKILAFSAPGLALLGRHQPMSPPSPTYSVLFTVGGPDLSPRSLTPGKVGPYLLRLRNEESEETQH